MAEIVLPYYKIKKIKKKEIINILKNTEIKEAHGGQNMIVGIKINKNIPKYSVLRRKNKIWKFRIIWYSCNSPINKNTPI